MTSLEFSWKLRLPSYLSEHFLMVQHKEVEAVSWKHHYIESYLSQQICLGMNYRKAGNTNFVLLLCPFSTLAFLIWGWLENNACSII